VVQQEQFWLIRFGLAGPVLVSKSGPGIQVTKPWIKDFVQIDFVQINLDKISADVHGTSHPNSLHNIPIAAPQQCLSRGTEYSCSAKCSYNPTCTTG